ncbi:hypothetical protein [Parapusillimonas granuli]|uniref:Uncharacterized protein n=1 Tax=Parapusillimonas granuli TaxID=380911 RepID=A0A853G5Y3_9BURK|nr:hypothetical protein [Parapusillimonas granuli]MBB5217147.1 hypothetical protein [Parapusillimonas granuli]MEB2401611.1 hypothetical protein [Alcaligenaceae bacterium]NYT50091.1 hypothetical protein [Parapusillimonas granuli]
MSQARIEPGETDISLAGREAPRKQADGAFGRDARGKRQPAAAAKKKHGQPKAGPLDRGIDLGG